MQYSEESEIYKNDKLYDITASKKLIFGDYPLIEYFMVEKVGESEIQHQMIHVFDCECHLHRKDDKVHFCDSCGKLRELNMEPGNQACKFMCNFRVSTILGFIKKLKSMPDCPNKIETLRKAESLLNQKYYY